MEDYDVVVIGSGFGGSVAALRLAEKGYSVGVLEAGRRWRAEDFPRTSWNLRRFLWAPRVGLRGIQRLTLLRHALVLSGVGVGGGSLVYANVLYEPPAYDPELRPYYDLARRMLGATRTPFETPADEVLRAVAERLGAAETYRPTEVAVDFSVCIRCGGCMIGCRYGAKNTLDRNYLRLAEEGGAVIHPEHEVLDVRQLDGGWLARTRRGSFRSEQIVLAAGVLGTLKLLFLRGVSPLLGLGVRTNTETLVGVTARTTAVDYSQGIAIGSSFDPRPGVQIQPVRYPRGSGAMGLLGKPLSLRRWAERTILLLCMGTGDDTLRLVYRRGRLRSEPSGRDPPPARIAEADTAAAIAAELVSGRTGRLRLNRPITAHILGGACIGESPETGVIDRWHRVFGHPGLHVVDGSAVGANLGVNPALTIAAQAERALAAWPRKGEPDLRPPLA